MYSLEGMQSTGEVESKVYVCIQHAVRKFKFRHSRL